MDIEHIVPNVVFMPWYLKSGMDSVGLNLSDIQTHVSDLVDGKETPLDKVSKSDLRDMAYMSMLFESILLNERFYNFGNITGHNWLREFRSLSKCTSKDQFMSRRLEAINTLYSSNTDFKDAFILMYENDTVYVILKEGFSNFIKFNTADDKRHLLKTLVNFIFKHFKPESVYASGYFKAFLKFN